MSGTGFPSPPRASGLVSGGGLGAYPPVVPGGGLQPQTLLPIHLLSPAWGLLNDTLRCDEPLEGLAVGSESDVGLYRFKAANLPLLTLSRRSPYVGHLQPPIIITPVHFVPTITAPRLGFLYSAHVVGYPAAPAQMLSRPLSSHREYVVAFDATANQTFYFPAGDWQRLKICFSEIGAGGPTYHVRNVYTYSSTGTVLVELSPTLAITSSGVNAEVQIGPGLVTDAGMQLVRSIMPGQFIGIDANSISGAKLLLVVEGEDT